MLDTLKRFFNKITTDDSSDTDQNVEHDIRVAACALFLEMANIDGEFSEKERSSIMSALKTRYGLPEAYAAQLVEASDEELKGSIDLWQFTNLINQNYTLEEKIEVIEMAWELAYADGSLDQHEDYLLHKLANLLRLSHKQLIEAKLRVLKGATSKDASL